MTKMITLPLGRVILRGCQPKLACLKDEGRGVRQGFPVALMRTGELDIDLVESVFLVVMRCLGS